MVGATITLDGAGYTVIGILPEVFDVGGFGAHDVWTPLKRDAVVTPRDQRDLQVFGRLAPGASVTAAKEEILALSVALQQEHPETNAGWQVSVLSFYEGAVGPNATAVFTLMSASVMFILLIACANVANLMLARAAMRRQELAVRQAMGAWRGRLVRQLITESGVLAVLSAGAGLLFAHWTLRGLVAMSGDGVTFLTQASIDTSVLVFAVGLAMATPLIFGVIPALRSTGFNLARATRDASGAGSTGRRRREVCRY